MAWRDELQPASFRNVPFKVASTNGQLGRRTVIHEYPTSDLPYAEDLGRKAREFSIEAFVIGPDYMTLRDDLIYALELPGAGELVHPFRGRQQVVLTSASVSESTDEGGMAKFSLSFTESGEPLNPARKVDTAQVVETAADEADAEFESDFFDGFNVDGLLDFVDLEALSVVGDALSAVGDAVSTVSNLATSALNQVNGVMSEFTMQAARISSGLSSLIRLPGNLAVS
jgi:prophage DNA circulation protein